MLIARHPEQRHWECAIARLETLHLDGTGARDLSPLANAEKITSITVDADSLAVIAKTHPRGNAIVKANA